MTVPIGVADLYKALRSQPRGPYYRAVLILTIRDLFVELEEIDQESLLQELALLIAEVDPADRSE
jgi:hypothetical protein